MFPPPPPFHPCVFSTCAATTYLRPSFLQHASLIVINFCFPLLWGGPWHQGETKWKKAVVRQTPSPRRGRTEENQRIAIAPRCESDRTPVPNTAFLRPKTETRTPRKQFANCMGVARRIRSGRRRALGSKRACGGRKKWNWKNFDDVLGSPVLTNASQERETYGRAGALPVVHVHPREESSQMFWGEQTGRPSTCIREVMRPCSAHEGAVCAVYLWRSSFAPICFKGPHGVEPFLL